MEYLEVLVNEVTTAVVSVNGRDLGDGTGGGCLGALFGSGGPGYPGKIRYFSYLASQGWQLVSSMPTRRDYFDATPFGKYMFSRVDQGEGYGEIEWYQENGRWRWRGL